MRSPEAIGKDGDPAPVSKSEAPKLHLVKSDVRLPLLYGAIFLVLMSYRAVMWLRKPTRPVRL